MSAIEKLTESHDPDMRDLAEYITRLEKYFDVEAYAKDVINAENGVFTEQGYLTESDGFHEVYRGIQDIPDELRIADTPPPDRKPSLLGRLAVAKSKCVTDEPDVTEKKRRSEPEL